MIQLNENYQKLPGSYLFAEIDRRVSAYRQANPDRELIKLGIGDVTRPLAPAVVAAMRDAVEEMGREETFRGYPPYRGYDFLLEAIAEHDYRSRGIELSPE